VGIKYGKQKQEAGLKRCKTDRGGRNRKQDSSGDKEAEIMDQAEKLGIKNKAMPQFYQSGHVE